MAADRDDAQRKLEQRALENVRDLLDKLETQKRDQARADAWFLPKYALAMAAILAVIAAIIQVSDWARSARQLALPREFRRVEDVKTGMPKAYAEYVLGKVHATARSTAIPDRMKGRVSVKIGVRADGEVDSAEITVPSGDANLDRAAIGIVMRAAPFSSPHYYGIHDADVLYITSALDFGKY